jgi:hypothetical protein
MSCFSHRRSTDVTLDIDVIELEEVVWSSERAEGFSKIARARITPGQRSGELFNYEQPRSVRVRPFVSSVTDLSWLSELYFSGENTRISSEKLTGVIVQINNLLKDRKFDSLTLILNAIQLDRVAPEVMIAFSRLTYPVRKQIPGWAKFVGRVEEALNSRNIDAKAVLRGLL